MRYLLLAVMLFGAVSARAEALDKKIVLIQDIPFEMEYAITPSEQRKGLSFREEVPDKTGMVFVNQTAHPVGYWMKNTYVALDMLFLDENGKIVAIVENAKPMNETPILINKPIKYVIEVPAGSSQKYNFDIGQVVKDIE